MSDGSGDDPRAAAGRLHEHLAATAELPVERDASRVLGEAEAVADDMRGCDRSVLVERAAVVDGLLEEIEGTGHEAADDHLEAARRLASEIAAFDE